MDQPDPVYLVFYRYDDDVSRSHPKWWLNWLTYKITGSAYIHVEIVFSNGDVYGIVPRQPITRISDKTYRRNNLYTCQMLYTSFAHSQAMRDFLEQRMCQPSGFNYRGFYMLPWFPFSGASRNAWFCSELVSSAMAAGGFDFGGVPPHAISPGALFELVQDFNCGGICTMLKAEQRALIV